jgi:aryl-alcohol dehydrogenase-like predicted oxidoreductase
MGRGVRDPLGLRPSAQRGEGEGVHMEYVRLGATGLRVSRLCLGMMSYGDPSWRDWVLPADQAEPFLRAAADADITMFDTADLYSLGASEEMTGRLLRKIFPSRSDYVLATKVFMPMGSGPNDRGLSRGHILDAVDAVDASLRRLGVDHIDLYQIHRWDDTTPVEETMEALHDCVRAGKVRYLGASSMYAWQFAKAQRVAALNGWTQFVSMQPHYNLLYREEEREMLPQCLDQGVGVLPWSPLARGRLARPPEQAGATARGRSDDVADLLYDDAEARIVDVVGEIAEQRSASRAQVALAWLLSKPVVTAPIVGVTRLEQLDEAVKALEIELSDEDIAALEAPYRPRPVRGHGVALGPR